MTVKRLMFRSRKRPMTAGILPLGPNRQISLPPFGLMSQALISVCLRQEHSTRDAFETN